MQWGDRAHCASSREETETEGQGIGGPALVDSKGTGSENQHQADHHTCCGIERRQSHNQTKVNLFSVVPGFISTGSQTDTEARAVST
jgi:hypothetical protein